MGVGRRDTDAEQQHHPGCVHRASSVLPEVEFFEGAEKLLELWFAAPSPTKEHEQGGKEDEEINGDNTVITTTTTTTTTNNTTANQVHIAHVHKHSGDNTTGDSMGKGEGKKRRGLRSIPREEIVKLLDLVKCEIVGSRSNDYFDSYVLSESSLFVWETRFILKTCGTTTLLPAVPYLQNLAKELCGMDEIVDIFYSRKNFMSPGEQKFPHFSFDSEVQFLDNMFKNGAAYTLGRLNGDCWHLYTLAGENQHSTLSRADSSSSSSSLMRQNQKGQPDQTLEILMSDLPREKMAHFYKDDVCNPTAKQVTINSGIAGIFPNAVTDEVSFDPCGYSVNGMVDGAHYFTIHITPQPACSYVSFETNVPRENYHQLIEYVLGLFSPGKFTLTLFANQDSPAANPLKSASDSYEDYTRRDKHYFEFTNYSLMFCHFENIHGRNKDKW
eukprot:Nk52_evm3s208 gene=Nk52_evmTU3s208